MAEHPPLGMDCGAPLIIRDLPPAVGMIFLGEQQMYLLGPARGVMELLVTVQDRLRRAGVVLPLVLVQGPN